MKVKIADYLINYIADLGVDKAFIVYGAANGDIVDAFTRTNKIQYVAVMHEQAGGFAAEGYAKVKGKKIPGVALATSGPGGMNFVTSIGNCYYDSVPAIFLTGQIKSQFLKPDPSIRQVGLRPAGSDASPRRGCQRPLNSRITGTSPRWTTYVGRATAGAVGIDVDVACGCCWALLPGG